MKTYNIYKKSIFDQFEFRKNIRHTNNNTIKYVLICFNYYISLRKKQFLYSLNNILPNEEIKNYFNKSNIWILDFLNYYQPLLFNHFVNFIKLNRKISY